VTLRFHATISRANETSSSHRIRIYTASKIHMTLIGICNLSPMTEALWNIDKGPNCFKAELITGFRARTRRKCAQEQMNIRTHDNSPSKVDTFVIEGGTGDELMRHLATMTLFRYLMTKQNCALRVASTTPHAVCLRGNIMIDALFFGETNDKRCL
jgi:hypothetical protein